MNDDPSLRVHDCTFVATEKDLPYPWEVWLNYNPAVRAIEESRKETQRV